MGLEYERNTFIKVGQKFLLHKNRWKIENFEDEFWNPVTENDILRKWPRFVYEKTFEVNFRSNRGQIEVLLEA